MRTDVGSYDLRHHIEILVGDAGIEPATPAV